MVVVSGENDDDNDNDDDVWRVDCGIRLMIFVPFSEF